MADVGQKISELEAAAALDGTELIASVQSGQTKRATAAQLAALAKSGLTKSDVGLGNVANVLQYSASNPPPTPSAADVGAIPVNQKGAASGVAELDSGGKVPSSQLPSYVDDVLEYESVSAFPATGESGKIYVAIDTGRTYRWSGSTYVEISNPVIIDDTLSVEGAAADAEAVGEALDDKQNTLTFDDAPISGSNNPVKSGGIYEAILRLYPTETVSGSVASFPDGAEDVPVKSLKVGIEPVQSGSGDPSPDNVRPISGWTGCNVWRTGKNLLPAKLDRVPTEVSGVVWSTNLDNAGRLRSFEANGTATSNAPFNVNAAYYNNSLLLKAGEHYTLSGCPAGGGGTTYRLYRQSFGIEYYDDGADVDFPVQNTDSACDIRMTVYKDYQASGLEFHPMIRITGSPAGYEPYCGDTYTIPFPAKAGTVYGGTLDVLSGVLTVDRVMLDLGEQDWQTTNPQLGIFWLYARRSPFYVNGRYVIQRPPNMDTPADFLCSKYKTVAANDAEDGSVYWHTTSSYVGIVDTNYTDWTTDQVKADLAGVQLLCRLVSPETYQLTAQQIDTLLGENRIWADTGPVSAEYRADPKLYVDSKIEALTALMSEL